MSYVSQKDHQLIKQMIFLPILVHVLEHDRERMLASQQVLRSLYCQWIDFLLIQIQNDLKHIKRECYRLEIKVSYKHRRDDLIIFHCSSRGYIFENTYTLSSVKWQLGIILQMYINQIKRSDKTLINDV